MEIIRFFDVLHMIRHTMRKVFVCHLAFRPHFQNSIRQQCSISRHVFYYRLRHALLYLRGVPLLFLCPTRNRIDFFLSGCATPVAIRAPAPRLRIAHQQYPFQSV